MKSPLWALQVAVVARIQSDTNYAVHDDHPEQKAFPYIVMGAVQALDWKDKSKPGQQVTLTLDFWSRPAECLSKKEVAEMINKVLQAIDYPWTPNLAPTFNVVEHHMDLNEIITDIDAQTFHGILKWMYLIEEL